MTQRRDHRGTPRTTVWCVIAIAMLWFGTARADKIDNLIRNLSDESDRVRITAVLALTNQQSPRAIPALAKKLGDRGEQKNIRGLAATALGRTVMNGKPSAAQRKIAIAALTRAKGDPEPFVSAKAEAALDQLGDTGGTTRRTRASGVYINLGPMSSKTRTGDDPRYRSMMLETGKATLAKVARQYLTSWPGGRVPTKAELDRKNIAGFYVDGTLNEVKVTRSGRDARVSCKVSMLLAEFPSKNVFGFLNGGAAVQTSASDIPLARQDCVMAVVEDLIAKKIVPTIRAKVGP